VSDSIPGIAPLYGLVLAGGRSRRMGRDKAALAYHGEPHVRRTAALLAGVCERVFVSRRADQAGEALFEGYETIPDAFDIGGPLNGILSALAAHPRAAFLVAACDLPFLSAEALSVLVANRDPSKLLTVFENPARENFLEPLCAIYEPGYVEQARAVMDFGLTCPTKIADALDAKRLTLRGPEEAIFLENANTPEDHQRALSGIGAFGALAGESVTVEYFAVFRERAKRASEEIALDGATLAEVYERLRARHGFALERASVHVAVNDAYASWDAALKPGDRLVFIPPVAGG
jgi:molybdopterin-guanine dinucleotide biosynthesis protein A